MGFLESLDRSLLDYEAAVVLPNGELPVPIPEERENLDYTHRTRLQIATDNRWLTEAELRFWGNPKDPPGEEFTGLTYHEIGGQRVKTKEQPAKYFYPEAVLVLATNRPKPTPSELEIAEQTGQLIDLVTFADLSPDAQLLFVAHIAGAFEEVIDLSGYDPQAVKPVAIVHHTPVTGDIAYPRSAWDLHATIGVARGRRLLRYGIESPPLTVERYLLNSDVLLDLQKQMTGDLKEQGFGRDQVRVTIRNPKPTGLGIHLLNVNENNLTSPEGIVFQRDIFTAISNAYGRAHEQIITGVPESFDFNGETMYRSDTPGHRQILHPYKNHIVYGLAPVPIGTHVGGADASGFRPHRSVAHKPRPGDALTVMLFNDRVRQRQELAVSNLGIAA